MERTPLLVSSHKKKAQGRRVAMAAAMAALALTCAGAYATVNTPANTDEKMDNLVERNADEFTWEAFKEKYGKSYDSEEREERSRRNFESRKADLERMNEINGETVFGITRHADREPGAFAYHRGRRPRSPEKDVRRGIVTMPGAKKESVADVVDWRRDERGVVTPVKNQGQCGSCWAFSATEQIESQMILAGSPAVELSPQQLASCAFDPEACCDGCGGGDPAAAYEYLIGGAAGLAPEAFWPYSQSLVPDGECESPLCTAACDRDVSALRASYEFVGPYAVVSGYAFATPECVQGNCTRQNLDALAARLEESPLSVCVNAQAWDDYTGGVLSSDACGGSGADDIDHCVQLVGYNRPENYWILRNSWSSDWGEDGYIRLQFDANTCGVANEATFVQIRGQWTQP